MSFALKRILKFLPTAVALLMFIDLFGEDSVIVNFFIDKVVFTPYNIVGLIMIFASFFDIYLGKSGSILYKFISTIIVVGSVISFIGNFIDLRAIFVDFLICFFKCIWKSLILFIIESLIYILLLIVAVFICFKCDKDKNNLT